jgi:iron-sulfur cluster repair protein YtfE (RIC family)
MSANAMTVVHKYLRRELFDLSEQLFRAGPSEVEAIRAAFDKLAVLLATHAAQEDTRLEPLLRNVDAALAERMMEDHRRIDDQFMRVHDAVRILDPSSAACKQDLLRLHLDWNRFVGAYLLHLDDEERTLFPRIAAVMPPLAAIAESARTQGPAGEEFLLRLWAVTTCEERAAIEQR